MTDICEKAKKNNCFRCLSKNGRSWMNDFCDNKLKGMQEATIECDDEKTNKDCADSCGNAFPGSRVVHLCFNMVNDGKRCPGMGCTIIHEGTHAMAGKGEEEAYGIEKCSGCRVPPKQKLPPGY